MPTTRKQNNARNSRGLEIKSDIENLDVMLDEKTVGTVFSPGDLKVQVVTPLIMRKTYP